MMAPIYRRITRKPYPLTKRVTPAGWLVFGLTILTGFMGVDSRTILYQLFALLLAISIVAICSTLFFSPRIRITRRLPRCATAGDAFEYPVEVEGLGRFRQRSLGMIELPPQRFPPVLAFLHEREPGEERRNPYDRFFVFYRWLWLVEKYKTARSRLSKPFDLPAAKDKAGSVTVTMHLTPKRRGILKLGRIGVLKPDIFGLLRALRYRKGPVDELVVLPKRYPLPRLNLPGRSQYQPAGLAPASALGQGDEFMSLRDYRPGDPLRHVHWRTWARMRRPVVKEYEDEFVPRYTLVLDTFADSDPADCFEEAVSVAASYACELDTRESLLDLLFVGSEAYLVRSERGEERADMLLSVLAGVELCGRDGFDSLHKHVLSRVRDMSACICLFLDWDDARRGLVRDLRANGVPVTAFVLAAPGAFVDAEGVHRLEAGRIMEGLAAC